ncbi:hypothetical protein BDR26DRAFT_113927 [Obelidium mucronatum]|nr:hypothetical protein BDR26DRAFT_113927 [Obelidium mucronatum]
MIHQSATYLGRTENTPDNPPIVIGNFRKTSVACLFVVVKNGTTEDLRDLKLDFTRGGIHPDVFSPDRNGMIPLPSKTVPLTIKAGYYDVLWLSGLGTEVEKKTVKDATMRFDNSVVISNLGYEKNVDGYETVNVTVSWTLGTVRFLATFIASRDKGGVTTPSASCRFESENDGAANMPRVQIDCPAHGDKVTVTLLPPTSGERNCTAAQTGAIASLGQFQDEPHTLNLLYYVQLVAVKFS